MTKQEKWDQIVQKIDELGWELQELAEGADGELSEDHESALMGLRMSVEHLGKQELEE